MRRIRNGLANPSMTFEGHVRFFVSVFPSRCNRFCTCSIGIARVFVSVAIGLVPATASVLKQTSVLVEGFFIFVENGLINFVVVAKFHHRLESIACPFFSRYSPVNKSKQSIRLVSCFEAITFPVDLVSFLTRIERE